MNQKQDDERPANMAEIRVDDPIWIVTDPTPDSTMAGICFKSSIRELALQFLCGLTADENPTIYTEECNALIDATARLSEVTAPQEE